MKKFKKLMSLAIAFSMTAMLFAGCSTEEKNLLGALMKNATINSGESKMTLNFNLSAKGLPAEQQKIFDQVAPMLSKVPIDIVSKFAYNSDRTASKAQIDINAMNMNVGIWSDSNMSVGEAKTIVKVPPMLVSLIPNVPDQFKGKEYIVMDTKEMMNTPELKEAMAKIDMAKLSAFYKDAMPKITEFIGKYAEQFNPNMKLITDLGVQKINTPSGVIDAKVYELKLDDTSVKALLKYTVSNFVQNKEAITFLKSFAVEYLKVAGLSGVELAEIEKSFAEFDKTAPEIIKQFETLMDSLKDVKLVGPKGINVKYAIDNNGYLVNEEGNMDFVIDMTKLNALDKKLNATGKAITMEKGLENAVINLGITYSSNIYNINKSDIKITLPEVNANNSVSFMEIAKILANSQANGNGNQATKITPEKSAPAKPAPTKPANKVVSITISKNNSITVKNVKYVTLESVRSAGGKITITKDKTTINIKGKKIVVTKNQTTVKNKKIYVSIDAFKKSGITIIVK